jgi:hypothetical protein
MTSLVIAAVATTSLFAISFSCANSLPAGSSASPKKPWRRFIRAAGRGYGYKICGGRELRVEIGVDRIEDSSPCIARNHCVVSCCRFQNRNRVHTLRSQIPRAMETGMPGNRNILFLIIGALIVAVGVLGYSLYQTKKQPEGLQINVGPNGLKIQSK